MNKQIVQSKRLTDEASNRTIQMGRKQETRHKTGENELTYTQDITKEKIEVEYHISSHMHQEHEQHRTYSHTNNMMKTE